MEAPRTQKPAAKPAATRTPQIFVNEPPGARPVDSAKLFYVLYQDAVPGIESGTIDVARTIAEIRRQRTLPEYGMLDFENPYSHVLKTGPSHPLHATVVRSMIETIRAVRRHYPNTKWTYWGFPEIPFWVDGTTAATWATATPDAREAARRKAVASHRALLLECDWISPWAYDHYENKTAGSAANLELERKGNEAWIAAKISIVRDIFTQAGRPVPPIIPCVSLLFAPGGRSPNDGVVPINEFRSDLIDPLLAANVDGIALWTPLIYFTRVASMNERDVPDGSVLKARQWIASNLRNGQNPMDWSTSQKRNDELAHTLLTQYVKVIADAAAKRPR